MDAPKQLTTCRVVLLVLFFVTVVVTVASALRKAPDHDTTSQPDKIDALALGTTNSASGQSFAVFQLTNSTRVEVGLYVEAVDQLISNEWTRTVLTGPARSWISEWIGERKNILPPRATYTFAAPAPVTNAAWRIVFRCVERQAVRDRSRELMLQFTNTSARNDKMFSGRSYHLLTPEVSP